jgi:hypothetical protein
MFCGEASASDRKGIERSVREDSIEWYSEASSCGSHEELTYRHWEPELSKEDAEESKEGERGAEELKEKSSI